jgi:uncharacterized protein (DUF1778 family)
MKTEKKKNARLEIRLSEEDLKLLKIASYMIGQTPSSTIRMFIDSTINQVKLKIKVGEIKIEDYETIFDN